MMQRNHIVDYIKIKIQDIKSDTAYIDENSNINFIGSIGVFELIAGSIAFLAILTAYSDRLYKHYEDTRTLLLDIWNQMVLEPSQFNILTNELLKRERSISRYIDLLKNLFEVYDIINIVLVSVGVAILLSYGINLLSDIEQHDVAITTQIFMISLIPSVGWMFSHRILLSVIRYIWIRRSTKNA